VLHRFVKILCGELEYPAGSKIRNHSGKEETMLELRPSCEHCNRQLLPESPEARICSFECTFCSTCVEQVLFNVCPNCGGGFCQRPIRPAANLKGNNFLGKYPAGTAVKYRPVDIEVHKHFAEKLKDIAPEKR
jgi:uncharacterized protein